MSIVLVQKSCLCYPEDKCNAPPELDPSNFLCACSCGAKICSICVGEAGLLSGGAKCRLCHVSNKENINLMNNSTTEACASSSSTAFFEICQSCNIKRFDADDDYGRHFGECRTCVQNRKGRRELIIKQPLNSPRDSSGYAKANRPVMAKQRVCITAKEVASPLNEEGEENAETLCTSVTHEMSPARSPTMVNQCTSVADPITTLESEQFVTSQKKCSLFPDDSGPPTNFVESGAVTEDSDADSRVEIVKLSDKENSFETLEDSNVSGSHEPFESREDPGCFVDAALETSRLLGPLETRDPLESLPPEESLESLDPRAESNEPIGSLGPPESVGHQQSFEPVEPMEPMDAGDDVDVMSSLSEEESNILMASLELKNRAFIVAFKSQQETVTVPTPGRGDAKRLVFTVIPTNKFTKVKGKNYGRAYRNNRTMVPRHYYCKEFFGDQHIQRYVSIEFHAFVVNRCRRNHDTLVLGLCGLRCTLDENEELKYVLCSSYFGNCGKLRHYVYVVESGKIEIWGSLIKTERGIKKKFYCDTTMPFALKKVLQCYLRNRASDRINPVFDPERYEKRYGAGKSENYVVPKLVFGDIDVDNPPIPAIMATGSDTRITRSSVGQVSIATSSRGRGNSSSKGSAKSGKDAPLIQERSRHPSVPSGESGERAFTSALRQSSKRSNGVRGEESKTVGTSKSTNTSLSKFVIESISPDNNDTNSMELEQRASQPPRAIATRITTRATATRGDDEEDSVLEVHPVKRGKATVCSALKELGEELDFHNKIVEQQYRAFSAIGGFTGRNAISSNQADDNQFREMWVSLMVKQQENVQKQTESQVQFLQQLILGQCQAQNSAVSEHMQRNPVPYYLQAAQQISAQSQGAQIPQVVQHLAPATYLLTQPQATQYPSQTGTQVVQPSTPPMQVAQSAPPVHIVQSASPMQVMQSASPMQVVQSASPMQVVQSASPMQVVQQSAPQIQLVQSTPQMQFTSYSPIQSTQTNNQTYYVSPAAPSSFGGQNSVQVVVGGLGTGTPIIYQQQSLR